MNKKIVITRVMIPLILLIILYSCVLPYNKKYELKIEINPPDSGQIKMNEEIGYFGRFEAGEEIKLEAMPIEDYNFLNWSINEEIISTEKDFIFKMLSKDVTITANFEREIIEKYELKIEVKPVDSGQIKMNEEIGYFGRFEAGEEIKLEAIPIEDYNFLNWSINEEIISTEKEFIFNMLSEDATITANFEREIIEKYELKIIVTPVDSGQIKMNEEIGYFGLFEAGEEIKLEAIPIEDYNFLNWSINEEIISTEKEFIFNMLSEDATITANFEREIIEKYELKIIVTPVDSGQIKMNEEIGYFGRFEEGEEIKLEAIPIEDYNFLNWSINEEIISTEKEFIFNMLSQDAIITANFEREIIEKYELKIIVTPVDSGQIKMNEEIGYFGRFEAGEEIKLEAIPIEDYNFLNWSINEEIISTEKEFIFNMLSQDTIITANFEEEKIKIYTYKTDINYLSIKENNQDYKKVFLNTMNIGVALPGRQPGETDIAKNVYLNWFNEISNMGFNSIRIYTLHRPQFYEAFYEFNIEKRENPLFLFHGIWLDYHDGESLNEYTEEFKEEIRDVINSVYGNNNISPRQGKAFGKYEIDISNWVIGWLLGREVEPYEVKKTNENYDRFNYDGNFFAIEEVNPTTAWITEMMDYTIQYEFDEYNKLRPISFSSWPTLDPLEHPSEPSEKSDEDTQQLDLYKIISKNANSGFFASYHAYPYYPDFMSTTKYYNENYSDEFGTNAYLGYLNDLKNKYGNIPLFIAEYGVPSSLGNAHFSTSGMFHGGHTYEEKGIYGARMLNNIYDSNCAGGAYFALFDEWWKRAWINDVLTFPRSEYKFWHDLTNPEQNFGLLTFKPGVISILNLEEENEFIDNIQIKICPQYFTIIFNYNKDDVEEIYIVYDTHESVFSEKKLPNDIEISNGGDLLIHYKLNENKAQIYVRKDYDLFGVWHEGYKYPQNSINSLNNNDNNRWNEVRWKNNSNYLINYNGEQIHMVDLLEIIQEIGNLKVSSRGNEDNLTSVIYDSNNIEIRIPWTLLQFSNPSQKQVVEVDHDNNELFSKETEGIALSFVINDIILETERIEWNNWWYENIENYTEIRKEEAIREFKKGIAFLPFYLE